MKITIKRHDVQYWIALLYSIVILYMPNFLRDISIIYTISAAGYVAPDAWNRANPWLSYSFTIFELIAVFVALFYSRKKRIIDLWPVLALVAFKEIIRLMIGETNMFQYGSVGDYSLILSILVGYGCFLIMSNKPVNMNLEDILDLVIILNFVTQVLFVITGRQQEYGGRYAALGSSTGFVGQMCFIYLLYYLFARKSEKRAIVSIVSCVLSLVLSGSRANIIFAVVFTIVFAYKLRSGFEKNKTKRLAIILLLVLVIIAVPILLSYSSFGVFNKLFDRISDFTTSIFGQNRYEYLSSDSSFTGRLVSIQAGLNILKSNPLGISSSTIDLQIQTQENGYYTFPHSALLSYYLLWGVAAILIYGYIIYYVRKAIIVKSQVSVILIALAISFLIYGSPLISPKSYFWYIAIMAYCKKDILDCSAHIIKANRN